MATVKDRIDNWATLEIRWDTQINYNVVLKRYNKGLHIFQKYLLEYASGLLNTSVRFQNIQKWKDEYDLPLGLSNVEDFYSIIQLRVAYKLDKNNQPLYKVCKPIDFWEYNIQPLKNIPDTGDVKIQGWQQIGWPYIWDTISMNSPKYIFVKKDKIKIFPTPIEDVSMWLSLAYNFMEKPVSLTTDEWNLNLPWYFFDAIDDYMSYMLYLKENPEMAEIYLQTFQTTLHDNIYWLNRDQRYSEENFANLSYFYKG